MQTYRIVVGFDGSEGGIRALSWAVAEAAQRGGTVQAVVAWSRGAINEPVIGTAPVDACYRATDLLASAVTAAGVAHPGVTVAEEAVEGPPARVLADAARDADLLVLGSHGHGRLFHAVLGSVAEHCIRAGVCPVVVIPVPHKVTAPAPPPTPITTATY